MKKMMMFFAVLSASALFSCTKPQEQIEYQKAMLFSASINGKNITQGTEVRNLPVEDVVISLTFSHEIDLDQYTSDGISFSGGEVEVSYGSDHKTLEIRPVSDLQYFKSYKLSVKATRQLGIDLQSSAIYQFSTIYDPSDKFERISDEELLTLVQKQTFKYFWDYAHPVSGLSRERLGSEETVTSGGSGFGVMTIPVGIERGFITREQGAQRMATIVDFLLNKAERFHGAFSHWLNGTTGEAKAFSKKDDGGDLVETALMMEGLLTVQQYFNQDNETEKGIRDGIQTLWEEVEWNWYLNDSKALFWHWSPNYGWDMNMHISGWNEALIVYVLAASSPTYPITKEVYDNGWARNGAMRNGRKYYGITLPLGSDKGGPLFFSHYSFLGLDPRDLSDAYASYWEQNVAHSRINYEYCKANPKGYAGYSDECWGLTASDYPKGYTASSPTNDKGTIAPTAALSSMPYTPQESLKALRYFYYVLGDRLFDEYGFHDSFSLSSRWFAPSYIAIDQGPIVIMIENYRTGLLWDNFMKNEDVKKGLDKLGFTYTE